MLGRMDILQWAVDKGCDLGYTLTTALLNENKGMKGEGGKG